MDFSLKKTLPVYREERFRTPSELERQFGLWVDRIGEQARFTKIPYLRKLGQYAAVFIEKGEGALLTQSYGEHEIKAGDIILLFPEEPTVYGPYEDWTEKWIVWNGPEATIFEDAGFIKGNRFIVKDKRAVFIEAFDALRLLIDLQDKAAILQRKIILTRFILDLNKGRPSVGQEYKYHASIEAALDFLAANYSKELSIDEIASKHNISTSHFRLLFKEYTGTSPRKFMTNLRISAAKKLLVHGINVKQAARQTGFQDVFYFIRVFKALTGESPGGWKKSHSKY